MFSCQDLPMEIETRFATLLRPILTWYDQKLKLSIPSRQSIPNIKKVFVTILISIDFQYLMRKRTKPDLFLLRPITDI